MPQREIWTAPARYVLTVLHRQDPDATPGKDAEGDAVTGWTVCGLPLLESELWQPVERRDSDVVCPECAEPGRLPLEEPEALLW